MHQALMQQPKSLHEFGAQIARLKNSTRSPKMTSEIKKKIPYKMNGTNPTKVSNCILRLLYDSDFMPKKCKQFPRKWPLKQGDTPLQKSEMLQNGWLQESQAKWNSNLNKIK